MAVGLLAAIGVVASLVFVRPSTNLVAFFVAAFTAGSVCLSIGLGRDLPTPDLLRLIPRWAGLGGLVVLSICGYAAAVGDGTFALVLLIACSSPPVVGWLYSRPADDPPAEDRPTKDHPAWSKKLPTASTRRRTGTALVNPKVSGLPADWPLPKYLLAVTRSVSELTDDELCLAWRRSFTQLQRTAGADRRTAMADVRRAYLDELERRHPDSFATWMASNPRAAGDPARWFTHRADH
ncbi:hypothetical protein AB0E69_25740 [Kribbella sp. NPDC026611]|uniref:hypothetical protein n=1 Tax=Kribbella sp. NPDC026611 TaxID=3154911 RepID=UPI0033C5D06A